MKKSILLLTAAVAMVLFGCKENPYINAPGENSQNLDSIPEMAYPDPTPDPEGVVLPEGCINVYEARRICRDLYAGQVTKEKYYVKGWVTEIHADHQDAVYEYGNGTFYISETKDLQPSLSGLILSASRAGTNCPTIEKAHKITTIF